MEGNSTVFYEEVDGGIEETTIESRNNSHNVTFNSNSNSGTFNNPQILM